MTLVVVIVVLWLTVCGIFLGLSRMAALADREAASRETVTDGDDHVVPSPDDVVVGPFEEPARGRAFRPARCELGPAPSRRAPG